MLRTLLNKHLKFFCRALCLLIIAVINFSVANSQELTNELSASELEWIKNHPIIKVSNPTAIAPFIFSQNGEVDGFAVDYLNLITSKVGLKIEFPEQGPWNTMMQMLRDGEIDLIQSAALDAERAEYIAFTQPYLEIPLVNIGREGAAKINNGDDLVGRKIGLVRGYVTSNEYLENYPKLDFTLFDTIDDALRAVSSSKIDVFTGNLVTINYSALKYFIPNLEVLGQNTFMSKNSIDHRLGATKENKILIDILQKAMNSVTNTEFIAISQKWQTSNTLVQDHDIQLTQEELDWIRQHPTVVVGNPTDSAPYSFEGNSKVEGIVADYLRLIGTKVGLDFKFAPQEAWNRVIESFRAGDIDIIHSAARNEERDQYISFTSPYMSNPYVNMGRIGTPRINSAEDLKDKRIGVIKGYINTARYYELYPEYSYVEFDDVTDALQALSASHIDVFTGNLISINYSILQNYIPNLEVIGKDYVLESDILGHHIGALKENQILVDIIEKAMAAISPEEFMTISEKWQKPTDDYADVGLSAAEKVWLSENKTISVALDQNLTPMVFIDADGKIDGITGDYLNLISETLGVSFEWIGNETFAEGMARTRAGEAHMVAVIAATPDREEFLTFTEPHAGITQMIFARDDGDIYGTLDALEGKKVAQITGYDSTANIRGDYPEIEIIEVNSVPEALQLISTGEADAHIGSVPITTFASSDEGITNITVVGEAGYRSENAMGIRSDLPLFASAMQKAMKSITGQQKAEISRRWLGIATKASIDYKLVWQIIFAATAIILFFIYSNQKLKESRLRAETANDAKSNFLANMSHEIRTPLNAIMGFSDAMLAGLGGEITNPKHQEYLKDIKNSGEHLATVIKDILDLSKIESGKWVLQEQSFLLDHCVEDALKIVASQARNKNIAIDLDMDRSAKIFGDDHAIRRVIINLLSNAIKFTGVNGHVKCSVSHKKTGGVCLEIADDGIGIPEDRLEDVLNPFEQSHNDHQVNEEGTGLGLPIVKNLVELHGGKFELNSKLGVGTTASIHLPSNRLVA